MIRRERNGGKGAAVKTGLRAAQELGFSHALQIDADGQHDTADIPKFLARAAERPQAAVLGHPVYDETDAARPARRARAHQLHGALRRPAGASSSTRSAASASIPSRRRWRSRPAATA